MPRKRKSLDELIDDRYEDDNLRSRVKEEIDKLGTGKRIERGELQLPTVEDAEAHFRRIDEMMPKEDDQWDSHSSRTKDSPEQTQTPST